MHPGGQCGTRRPSRPCDRDRPHLWYVRPQGLKMKIQVCRGLVQLSVAGLLAGALLGCDGQRAEAPSTAAVAGGPAPAKKKPNVLFIAVDDLRAELGCLGSPHIKTPNIDRIAARGVTFTRAYCQQAVCNPSRASLMTGLRPDSTRVWDLRTDFRDTIPDVVTLPQHFKRHGYFTTAVGKIYHNTLPDDASWSEPKLHVDGFPFDPDAVYLNEENVAAQEAKKERYIEAGEQDRHIDRLGHWYIKTVATEMADADDSAYFDGAQTDLAVDKIAELKEKDQPFFFGVGYYRPHLPFNAPRKYWDMYDPEQMSLADNGFMPKGAPIMSINTMRELLGYDDFRDEPTPYEGVLAPERQRHLKHGYYASVSYVDAQIGRLLDALEDLGLADDTIVVLWGDHGWKLGEHASWCKMTNLEIDARVPMIMSVPGMAGNGRQSNALVEFVDIYPTLCEAAELPLPEGLEGTSYLPLLEEPDRLWKTAAFSQFLREGIWVAPDGVEYMGYAVRTDRYRYVEWERWDDRSFAARELYDHQIDPHENVNMAGDPAYAAALEEAAAILEAGWKGALPPGRD
ncbi:MAG: sulfatase [Acidobacteria bacterium]|nr:sulfatase [Acidobacteriota bacterium]